MEKVTRREFLATGVAATAGGVAPRTAAMKTSARASHRPPNVLMIVSDQHTPRAMGVAGNSVARTPSLDALAGTGVRFDHAYCTFPECVASRASFITGLYAHHHKAYNVPFPFRIKTLAHYLGHAGYMTGAIGKMHFVDAQTHGFDFRLDFNDWFQYLGPKTQRVAEELISPNSGSGLPQVDDLWRESGDPWTGFIERDNREGNFEVGRISALAENDHFEAFVARESMRFLRDHGKEQPFFLISSFLKPHGPFNPAQRFAKMFHAVDMQLPETWGKADLAAIPQWVRKRIHYDGSCPELRFPDAARQHIAMYYACLAQTDDEIGKVLRTVTELGLDDNTIVLYTSDHGEMLGEHGLWRKILFYEPSVGVPLLFRVPGVTTANARCTSPVSLVQLVATLLELCNVPIPAGLDGASFARLLREPAAQMNNTIFAELSLESKVPGMHGGELAIEPKRPGLMIREGRYKYCYYAGDTDELYDLASDPAEMKNLAPLAAYRQKRDELKEKLFAWRHP